MESIVNEIIVAAGIKYSSERIRIAVKCMYSSISNMYLGITLTYIPILWKGISNKTLLIPMWKF